MKRTLLLLTTYFVLLSYTSVVSSSCSKDPARIDTTDTTDTIIPPPPPPPPVPIQWTKLSDSINNGTVHRYLDAGVYNGKLYLAAMMRVTSGYKYGIFEYDSTARSITESGNISTAQLEYSPMAFLLGNTYYIHTNVNNQVNVFRAFNLDSKTWSNKATLTIPGSMISPMKQCAFSMGNAGYIYYHSGSTTKAQILYKYDPVLNQWTQHTQTLTTSSSIYSVPFINGNRAFFLTEDRKLTEYNTDSTGLMARADFGDVGFRSAAFVIGDTAHITTVGEFSVGGSAPPADTVTSTNIHNNHWGYSISSNTWTRKSIFNGPKRAEAIGFVYNGKGYLLGGRVVDSVTKKATYIYDLWRYTP